MTTLIEVPSEQLEDLVAADGLATLCLNEQVGEQHRWSIIFPISRERDLYSILNEHKPEVLRLTRGEQIRFKTILYHLAQERFRIISTGSSVGVSTTIQNLHAPSVEQRPHLKFPTLGYEVDLVVIGTPSVLAFELKPAAEKAVGIADLFNATSRYLAISSLRIGAVTSRFRGSEDIEFTALPLRSP